MNNLMSRVEFDNRFQFADLSDCEIRQQINGIVIDEIVKSKFFRQCWEVQGFAPLDTSMTKHLRPTPTCVWDSEGWRITFKTQWFVD